MMKAKRVLLILLLLTIISIKVVLRSTDVEAQSLPSIDYSLPWKDGNIWRFTGSAHRSPAIGNPIDTWDSFDLSPCVGPGQTQCDAYKNLRNQAVTNGLDKHTGLSFNESSSQFCYNGNCVDVSYLKVLASAAGNVSHISISNGIVYTTVDGYPGVEVAYAHMYPILVNVGEHVSQGEVIGIANDKAADPDAIHLHIGTRFNGSYVDIEDNNDKISFEGWGVFNYHLGDGITRPTGHPLDTSYYGYLKREIEIKHACISTSGCPPYEANDSLVTAVNNTNYCSIQPGDGAAAVHKPKYADAFNRTGGQTVLGCPTNGAHWYGEVVDGVNHQFVVQNFDNNCSIVHDENANANTAYAMCGAINSRYWALQDPPAWKTLGAPVTDEYSPVSSPFGVGGRMQDFKYYGRIASSQYGAFEVYGGIHNKWIALGATNVIGFPKTGEFDAGNEGRCNGFESGDICWTDEHGAFGVLNQEDTYYGSGVPIQVNMYDAWAAEQGTNGGLGYPTSDRFPASSPYFSIGGYGQGFEHGDIYRSEYGTFAVKGDIFQAYKSIYGTNSWLGFPKGNEQFNVYPARWSQEFESGFIYCWGPCYTSAKGYVNPEFTAPETNLVDLPEVCANTDPFTFTFTGGDNTTSTEDLLFSHKLNDSEWSVFEKVTFAEYSGLQNGAYTFHVKAQDFWGNVDESPAEYTFEADTTAPETSAIVLTGTPGQNGWYTSLVDLQLNRTDTGCGSSNIQTWVSFNGSSVELYDGGPLTFDQEGIHALEVYSVDAAGNQESVKTFEIKIDWTPPVVSGNATGPRDTNGVFRGDVTIDGIATDNLSGVDLEEMSLDGGSNWQSMSQTVLTGNGTGRVLYRATDIAGNVSSVLDSGQVIINQYVVFANQPVESLLVDGTTDILIEGDMHTNGSARFKYNTGSTVNGIVSAVSTITTSQGNTNLSLGGIQQNAPSVPMLSYPMSLYQSLCDVNVTGDLVIDSVAQNMEGVYCVTGNLSLRSVLLSGPVTFVVNGNITDDMVGSDLQTNDPYNGVMMIVGGNVLLRGDGYDLLGLIYAPNGTITLKNNDVRINGSLVAHNIVFDGTGSGFELRYNAAFTQGTFPLPLSENSFWGPSENGTIPTPAPTAQPTTTPQPTATPTATPAPTVQPTATPVPTVVGGGTLYVSTDGDEEIGSVAWDEEDIVTHNPASETWAMLFDGSDVNAENVDALHVLSDGSVLVSFDYSVTLSGLSGTVSKEDIVKFTPTQSGNTTTGTWSWYFDGSDVGLSSTKNVNALHVLTNGKLVVSFSSGFTLSGPGSIQDEDLVVFTPTQLGATTAGSWAWYLDGSDVQLDENIDGVWVAAIGDIYISTSSSWDEVSIDADDEDIFVCANPTIGSNSSCTFGTSVYWGGSAHGMSGDVDAFHIVP